MEICLACHCTLTHEREPNPLIESVLSEPCVLSISAARLVQTSLRFRSATEER